jgi:hypothetical protein
MKVLHVTGKMQLQGVREKMGVTVILRLLAHSLAAAHRSAAAGVTSTRIRAKACGMTSRKR